MKIIVKNTALLLILLFSNSIAAQNAEDIIKEHLKVVNQDKLSKVETKVVKGTLFQSGVEVDLYIAQMRGDKMNQVLTFNGSTHKVVFNTDKGWEKNQFAGHTEPQKFDAKKNMSMIISSDIDSKVATFLKLKGTYKLISVENIGDKECYKITFDVPNFGKEDLWFDKNDYTVRKSKDKSGIEKTYKGYSGFDDVLVPIETLIKLPSGDAKIIIKSVEYDVDLDESQFNVE